MLPPLETLDYAGACIQARPVGGDYYDLVRYRLALVVGDIAGKGIAAALSMASLHASLRSQRTQTRMVVRWCIGHRTYNGAPHTYGNPDFVLHRCAVASNPAAD